MRLTLAVGELRERFDLVLIDAGSIGRGGRDANILRAGSGIDAAILVDATLIRMLLVPAVMHLLGRGNWWLPRGMARRLPQLHIEGPPIASTRPLDDAEPAPSRLRVVVHETRR